MAWRARALVVAAAPLGGAIMACTLAYDLSGFSGGAEAPVDAASDTAPEAAPDGAGADADASLAAEVTPPACTPAVTMDDTFSAGLGTWSAIALLDPGYPRVDLLGGSPAAVLFPFVDTTPIPVDGSVDGAVTIPPERIDAIGGIWQLATVPLVSFDVSFDFYVACTSSSSCADGLAFSWLDTPDSGSLTNMNYGNVEGLPSGVSGTAVVVDDYRNSTDMTSDPPVPAIELVRLDGAQPLGKYPWVQSSQSQKFLSAWHTLAVSVRGTSVGVTYDGASVVKSATLPGITRGLIGLSSGTGGQTDAVAVRNFKGKFYDCPF